jgi:hypothetical protein
MLALDFTGYPGLLKKLVTRRGLSSSSTRTADSGGRSGIIGCVGVLCLAVYWAAIFFPQITHILAESSTVPSENAIRGEAL